MDYTSAIIYMKRHLPDELINIIAHYVAKYNLYNLCLQLDINFKKLNKFLSQHGGTITGKCAVSCIINSWVNGMKIIFPLSKEKIIDDLFPKKFIRTPPYNSVYSGGKVLYIRKFRVGDLVITMKYSSVNVDECYGISGDRVSFNGKEFNFGSQNLGEYIRRRTITVDTVPRSFSSTNHLLSVSNGKHITSSILSNCKSLSLPLDYILFYVKYRNLHDTKEIRIIDMIFHACKNNKNRLITNYLRRIFWFIAQGYRIANMTELESLIN